MADKANSAICHMSIQVTCIYYSEKREDVFDFAFLLYRSHQEDNILMLYLYEFDFYAKR